MCIRITRKMLVYNRRNSVSSGYVAFMCMISITLASMSLVYALQYSVSNVGRILVEYVSNRNVINISSICALSLKAKIISDIGYVANPIEQVGKIRCVYEYKSGVRYGKRIVTGPKYEPVTVDVRGISDYVPVSGFELAGETQNVVFALRYSTQSSAELFSGLFEYFEIVRIFFI